MSKPNLRKSENSPWFLSRYCGINFGVLRSEGFPVHAVDYLCYLHDNAYQDLIDNGKSKEAYFEWNYADEAFMTGLEKLLNNGVDKKLHEHVVLHVAKALFELKKAVAKKGETEKSPEELDGIEYLLPKKYLQYAVSADGSIEVESTAKESDYITPDRPPKRIPHSIAPKHPDLKTLLENTEREDDEDLMLAVNLSDSFRNSPPSTDIDTGGEDMSSGQLDATPVTKATPVYGEQNSQTIITPWNGIFSVYNLCHDRINRVDLRMTSPYDIMRTFANDINGGARPGSESAKNLLYRRPLYLATKFVAASAEGFANTSAAVGAATSTLLTFGPTNAQESRYIASDTTFLAGGNNKERGAWFDYYSNNYKYYTVLGCEYEIKVTNITETPGADVMVGCLPTSRVKPPVQTTVAGTTFYAKPFDAIAWKGVQWHMVNADKGQNGINNILTIKGTYRRGDNKELEIMNDDKREIWNPKGQLPQVPEDLSLIFMKAPGAYAPDAARTTVNVYMRMKYIVQFKELTEAMEYPVGTNDSFANYTTPISTWRDVDSALTTEETTLKNQATTAGDDTLVRKGAGADKLSEMDSNMEDS
jgi:hypothetical protein